MKNLKKVVSIVMAVLMTLGASAVSFAGSDDIVVDDSYVIKTASEDLSAAASTFSNYINDVTGYTLPVVTDSGAKPCIALKTDPAEVENGYHISSDTQNIFITGSSLQQTVRGMYAFLEDYAGIRCYTKDLYKYTKDNVSIPKNTSVNYTPYFEYTDTDWLSPKDEQYSLFNGINGGQYRTIGEEYGGTMNYISGFAHTLTNQFCSSGKYYEEHPEYFALYRGIRTNSQLCLSNPDVLQIVTDEVLELLKERHDKNADLQIVSLTQHDNIWYCTCDKCRATDRKYGSHAGTMIEFVNAVARRVKEEGYDNVAIDTFAYRYTRKPPKGIVPEDNVIVRLCSIECCFSHAFDDKTCQANKAFMEDLEGWSEICNRIYIWDYCTNFANWVGLFPDFGVLQRDIQILYEHNVLGIYEEGNFSMDMETEFGELRSYLIGKLFQNPYCDYETLRDEFCNAYYGEGGKYISEFLDIITENASSKHLGIYQSMKMTLSLSPKQVIQCEELWEKAKAETSGEELDNVLHSEIAWRWWKKGNYAGDFSLLKDRKSAIEALDKTIADFNVVDINEMGDTRAFWVMVYQDLYYIIYPVLSAVLKLLYIV